jgi:hypothetical protein
MICIRSVLFVGHNLMRNIDMHKSEQIYQYKLNFLILNFTTLAIKCPCCELVPTIHEISDQHIYSREACKTSELKFVNNLTFLKSSGVHAGIKSIPSPRHITPHSIMCKQYILSS